MASITKEKGKSTWQVQTSYKTFEGKTKRTTKRGFKRRKDAIEWEKEFQRKKHNTLDMTLASFIEIYAEDNKNTIRWTTWGTKDNITRTKILPYLGERRISEITPADIRRWQNEIQSLRKKNGKPYAETYLRTIHAQLTAYFNHAVKFYGLRQNPATIAGSMGSGAAEEMKFWVQEEFQQFVEAVADKADSYYAFELLYWSGIRLGEMMALTPNDIDFENNRISITKSYSFTDGKATLGPPKTKKSYRKVLIQQGVMDELKNFIDMQYGLGEEDRIFSRSKGFYEHEMERGAKKANLEKIRVHDLRHSHVSLLIHMGYSALAIGERVGHEAETITYRYAHLFPTVQTEMVSDLDKEKERLENEQ